MAKSLLILPPLTAKTGFCEKHIRMTDLAVRAREVAAHRMFALAVFATSMSVTAQTPPLSAADELNRGYIAVRTQQWQVQGFAAACQKTPGVSDRFSRDNIDRWTEANRPYVNAAMRYKSAFQAYLTVIASRIDMDAVEAQIVEHYEREVTSLIRQNADQEPGSTICARWQQDILEGKYNFGPKFPGQPQIDKLMQVSGD